MPRSVLVLLLASLLGNAALLLVVARRSSADPFSASAGTRASGPRSASGAGSAALGHGEPVPDALSPEVAAILNSRDPARLHALLLAAGVDEDLRSQLVHAALWKNYEARLKALGWEDEESSPDIWWKDSAGRRRYDSPEERARSRASNLLHKEINAEFARITGTDPDAFEPEKNNWLARKYGGLPREKSEALYRIDRDYDDLLNEISEESRGFTLPSDVKKRRLIEAEREKDLAALLTPEERLAWEMRNSDTADNLRHRMTELDATEDEYHRIYTLRKAFDAEFERSSDDSFDPFAPAQPFDETTWERRQAAEKRLEADIRAIIGEERYTAAARENDPDFTGARAAAERLGLPAETTARVLALREPAAAESRRIAADPALSIAEKKAALARLAATTRAEVVGAFGPEGAEAYFERGGMRWLKSLENGGTVTFEDDQDGGYDTVDLDDEPDPLPARLEPIHPTEPVWRR